MCFFTLNSLGYAIESNLFMDIEDEQKLAQIYPKNIITDKLGGYSRYFPKLKRHFEENGNLINNITTHHDVSKHRQAIFQGGKLRFDAPSDYWEMMGIHDDEAAKVMLAPYGEVLLHPSPKTPESKRESIPFDQSHKLETLAEDFCEFINKCGELVLSDAKDTIPLKHRDFIK